jgi:thioredoxin-dependent peroxiredoxin
MSLPRPGDPAPDFRLPEPGGHKVALSDFVGKQPLVLYFYPKDETPGCTREACAFRDAYAEFVDAGAAVVGVSGDGGVSHAQFAARHRLPFPLLTDADGAARRAYGVPRTLGLLEGRVTFVIDKAGVIRHAFNSQIQPQRHVAEALRVIRALRG